MAHNSTVKISARALSLFAALVCWALLSALAVFIVRGMRESARLIRDNDNERLFNTLFTGLRNYEDFGSAIEDNPALRERITGFAIYASDLSLSYSWGIVPPVFDEGILEGTSRSRFGRFTIPDPSGLSVKFILQVEAPRMMSGSQSSGGTGRQTQGNATRQGFPFFNALARGRYYYVDIFHPAYWKTIAYTTFVLPLICIVLLALVLYVRFLYLRNREYRQRIEAQKSLVILGTAARTLAHEIKNPLSSIRLQTGILEKLFPENGKEEVAIINEEIDRLSALSHRVGDYLRDSMGNPEPVELRALLAETGTRLCGRNILDQGREILVMADPERLRSVFENLIRNALESGGAPESIEAAIKANPKPGGRISISILDRGKGIAKEDEARLFDLFFTRKGRGTGIGLSICKRFVDAAGGSISLENRDEGGAEARIVISEYVPAGSPSGEAERAAGWNHARINR